MSDMAVEYKLREFTVDEYHRLAETGVLRPDERVELLDGTIVEMSPIGDRHWRRHARISAYLAVTLASDAFVVPQGSFPLGYKNEPQPDLTILAPHQRNESERAPTPQDIYAVIDIADSLLGKDTGPKLRLYARFGIRDYFVVDVESDILVHYYDPNELDYRSEDWLHATDTFTMGHLAHIALSPAPFLGSHPRGRRSSRRREVGVSRLL
jgi:Uma2 family endonuclease